MPTAPPAKNPARRESDPGETKGDLPWEESDQPDQSLTENSTPGVSQAGQDLKGSLAAENSEAAGQGLINMAETVTETQTLKKVEGKSRARDIDSPQMTTRSSAKQLATTSTSAQLEEERGENPGKDTKTGGLKKQRV